MRLHFKLLTRLPSHPKGLLGEDKIEGQLPSTLICLLPGLSYLLWAISTRLPHNEAAGFSRGKWRTPFLQLFYNLISKATTCHLYCILVLRNISKTPAHIQGAKVVGLYKDLKTRR